MLCFLKIVERFQTRIPKYCNTEYLSDFQEGEGSFWQLLGHGQRPLKLLFTFSSFTSLFLNGHKSFTYPEILIRFTVSAYFVVKNLKMKIFFHYMKKILKILVT